MSYFPKRLNFLLLPFFVSFLMTVFISACGAFIAVGAVNGVWLDLWFNAWSVSWVIAFPALVLVMSVVRKVTILSVGYRA